MLLILCSMQILRAIFNFLEALRRDSKHLKEHRPACVSMLQYFKPGLIDTVDQHTLRGLYAFSTMQHVLLLAPSSLQCFA